MRVRDREKDTDTDTERAVTDIHTDRKENNFLSKPVQKDILKENKLERKRGNRFR